MDGDVAMNTWMRAKHSFTTRLVNVFGRRADATVCFLWFRQPLDRVKVSGVRKSQNPLYYIHFKSSSWRTSPLFFQVHAATELVPVAQSPNIFTRLSIAKTFQISNI